MSDSSADEPASLGRAAARGAAFSFGGQASKIVVQLVGLVVLSRLLGPEQFGLIAMVTAIIGIGELLRDFGLSAAAVQAKILTHRQQSNLFWINTLIGLALTVTVVASSGAIAAFYDRAELTVIAICLSVTFLLNGFSTQFRVHLNRDLRFGSLASVDVLAQFLGITSAVVVALNGWTYQALIVQVLVQTSTVAIGCPVIARWWPGLPRRGQDMSPLLRFGSNVAATQLISYVSRSIDSIVIGARFGSVSLGLYDRAFQMFMSPLNQIQAPATNVALPVLRRIDDEKRYAAFLLRGQAVLMHFLLAAFAFAWANASWLMGAVFGPQWLPAVPYLQILLIAGCAQVASYATYWVFLSKGIPGSNLRFTLASRTISITLILVGSLWSPYTVAWGFALGAWIAWPMGLWWVSRATSAPVRSMFLAGVRALSLYISAAAVAYAVPLQNIVGSGLAVTIGRGAIIALVVGIACVASTTVRTDVSSLTATLSLLRKRKQNPT